MDKLLENAAKLLPEYLTFVVDFIARPMATMRRFAGRKQVDASLAAFLVVGIVVSSLILLATIDPRERRLAAIAIAKSWPWVARLASYWFALPVIAVLSMFLVAVVFHILATGYHRLLSLRRKENPFPLDHSFHLRRSIFDTINAINGFASVYVLIVAVWFVSLTAVGIYRPFTVQLVVMITGMAIKVAVLLAYLPAALVGTHEGTRWSEALLAGALLAGAISLTFILAAFDYFLL